MKATLRFFMAAFMLSGMGIADEVTDWNQNMLAAMRVSPAVAAPLALRPAAIVMTAIFDAVNGIERRYAPVHVMPDAPPGASTRAAAVQAGYASLVHLFPAQTATFDQERMISLINIASGPAAEHSESIQRGIEWGQTVADAIWEWRSTDGFSNVQPPYLGAAATGAWRPTPPALLPGLAPQLAQVTPWTIASPSQFRPAGPLSLTSAQYATDLNETETMGSVNSSTRTQDQTLYARFWQSAADSPADYWDPVAQRLSDGRHFNLLENARLFALLNMSLADAIIGCWDAKYTYSSWRPITAIQLADTDGNPATTGDPNWTPLIVTPPFPEYPSAHSCASGAAARILTAYFGDNTPFSVMSTGGMPGVTRYFSSFTSALDEVKNARVFGGIHFRTACNDGQALGTAVADYTLSHALLRLDGDGAGKAGHQ
jgi:hypothetical protein